MPKMLLYTPEIITNYFVFESSTSKRVILFAYLTPGGCRHLEMPTVLSTQPFIVRCFIKCQNETQIPKDASENTLALLSS
jgi:hypothetical protein